jgi:peptide/nickel transport system permease protein
MSDKPKPKSERYRGLQEFLNEFRRSKSGLLGLIMILAFVAISAYSAVEYPYSRAEVWNNQKYWLGNPISVPPVWIQYLINRALPQTMHLTAPNGTKIGPVRANGTSTIFEFVDQSLSFDYDFDDTPSNVIISMSVNFSKSSPTITITWVKPPENAGAHETDIVLEKFNMPPGAGEAPYYNVSQNLYPVADKGIKTTLASFLQTSFNKTVNPDDVNTLEVLFGTNESLLGLAPFQVLKGTYHLTITYVSYNSAFEFAGKPLIDNINSLQLILGGKVFGLMGTDSWGRDLFVGILWGAPAALIIGLLTSVVSVAIGVFLGVLSGFYGGRIDDVVQRITDYFLILPFLPLLIFLSFILHPSIWNLIWLLSLFGWPGITKVVRSIALQIRESGYVEAARALGASNIRILMRHVLPQALPYTFANIALSVPGAIFAEASISFLGLGDPVIPTWGKILGDAQANGAVIGGYWWWVLIPGLCIILVAMSFALLGNALDRILTPKLRRR